MSQRLPLCLLEKVEETKAMLAKFKERKSNPVIESIGIQLDYIYESLTTTGADISWMKDINVGLLAVREVEGIDDNLANNLYEIDAWVRTELIKKSRGSGMA